MSDKIKSIVKSRGFPRKILVSFLIVCALAAIGLGTAYAFERSSANYKMTIDALTTGGGEAASASYLEIDGAVGQSIFFGEATSAGYQDQSGVVQAWPEPDPSTAARNWRKYGQVDK